MIAKRYQDCADYHLKTYGIRPLFGGLFWNFCLNVAPPESQASRVHCLPHIDCKNIALGLCMIFVYHGDSECLFHLALDRIQRTPNRPGPFNHREYCWLVLWEAKVIIQIPPGVFVLYPSSLFHHFNVDICGASYVLPLPSDPLTAAPCQILSGSLHSMVRSQHRAIAAPSCVLRAAEMGEVAWYGTIRPPCFKQQSWELQPSNIC